MCTHYQGTIFTNFATSQVVRRFENLGARQKVSRPRGPKFFKLKSQNCAKEGSGEKLLNQKQNCVIWETGVYFTFI